MSQVAGPSLRRRFAALLAATACLTVPGGELLANRAQARICRAGINFGQAEARTYLFGRAGAIPADQLAFISTNVANAAAEIGAAESLVPAPFATEPTRRAAVSRLVADLGRYSPSATESSSRQAAHVQNLAGRYLSTLQATFDSSRADAFRYSVTCGSTIFNACYFYGKATIASVFPDDRARALESGAVSTFRTSVRDGLAIAMDAAGHLPPDGHAGKICCTFGSPSAWAALNPLQTKNSTATYAELQAVLLGIIEDAIALDPVCATASAGTAETAPSPVTQPPRGGAPSPADVTGWWRCRALVYGVGRDFRIERNPRGGATVTEMQTIVAIRPGDQTEFATTYPATTEGHSVTWEVGSSARRTRTTLSLGADGGSLTGAFRNTFDGGASWTAPQNVSCSRAAAPAGRD